MLPFVFTHKVDLAFLVAGILATYYVERCDQADPFIAEEIGA